MSESHIYLCTVARLLLIALYIITGKHMLNNNSFYPLENFKVNNAHDFFGPRPWGNSPVTAYLVSEMAEVTNNNILLHRKCASSVESLS